MQKCDEVAKKRKRHEIERWSDWGELPNGPLTEIAHRLSNFEDFEALHLVCSHWNSALRALQCKFIDGGGVGCKSTHQVPWLMMAESETTHCPSLRPCSSKGIKALALRLFFYRLSFKRVRELVFRLPPLLGNLEGNFNNYSLYSSHGWLLFVKKGSPMCLYNPLASPTHNSISLPRNDIIQYSVRRFILSASPCSKSYTVILVYAHTRVAFWRPGVESWTLLEHYACGMEVIPHIVLDVAFYRGYYYSVDGKRNITQIRSLEEMEHYFERTDTVDDEAIVKSRWRYINSVSSGSSACPYDLWRAYFVVVESSSEKDEDKLWVVVRLTIYEEVQPHYVLTRYDHLTAGFQVTEIVLSPNHKKEVKSLGNKSLFVGRNQAFAIEVPQEGFGVNSCYYGCKPNRIYFTDDRYGWPTDVTCRKGKGKDMGVYNMADGSIERHFQGLSSDDYSPMLWVEPRC